MKKTVDKDMFRAAFNNANYWDHFSNEALGALFDHLTNYEEETGEEMELDPISICSNYTEYSSAVEAIDTYNSSYRYVHEENATEEEKEAAALEWLYSKTVVIEVAHFGNTIIIQDF